MKTQNWRDLMVRAVEGKNEELLDSLAHHLEGCEKANSILRNKGYGKQGQAIDVTVASVPNAREWG